MHIPELRAGKQRGSTLSAVEQAASRWMKWRAMGIRKSMAKKKLSIAKRKPKKRVSVAKAKKVAARVSRAAKTTAVVASAVSEVADRLSGTASKSGEDRRSSKGRQTSQGSTR